MLDIKKLLTKITTSVSTLFAHLITFENKLYSGQYTIGSSGYVSLGVPPSPITGSTVIVSAFVYSWSANTGAFSVALGSGNVTYLVGTPGVTITNPAIRYTYFGGGYCLKVFSVFSRLAERWWEYAEREETAHENIEAAISYIDGSANIGYCSRRCICVGKCTNTKWVYSNRGVLYRLHLLLNEEYNNQHKQFNNQYLREKLDKLFHLNLCQCTSEYRTITISGRGWSCA